MANEKYKQIQQIQLTIIILNISASFLKIVFGLKSNSASMTADGIHSLTDGVNNVVGMIGIYFAFQPKDMVMFFTIALNIFITKYERKWGENLKSDFLISDAAHTLLVHQIDIAIKSAFPGVSDVNIHVDPPGTAC